MDAAEELFARHGFYGASLRDITRVAGVELGLSSYHFRSKEELYRQVLFRRAADMANDLENALDAVLDDQVPRQSVQRILGAYTKVHLDKLKSPDPGWRSYVRLAAQAALLLQSSNVTKAAAEVYGPVIARYKAALNSRLNGVDPTEIDRHFYVFSMALLGIALDISNARPRLTDVGRSDEELINTLIGIFTDALLVSGKFDRKRPSQIRKSVASA